MLRNSLLAVLALTSAFGPGSLHGQPPAPVESAPPATNVDPVDPVPPAPDRTPPPIARDPFQDWLTGPASVRRRSRSRLASAPDMFGDSIRQGFVFDQRFDLPLSRMPLFNGGGTKIAENGNAGVSNRLILDVRHFDAGLEILDGDFVADRNFQRYTLGFEKVIDRDGTRSFGVRLPITSNADVDGASTASAANTSNAVSFDASGVRTIGLIFKQEVRRTETWVASVGLGVGVPVQRDTIFRDDLRAAEFHFQTEAIDVQPFVGLKVTPTDALFFQGFLQLDVPTTGNPVDATLFNRDRGRIARLNPQTVLYVDAAAGLWLFRNERSRGLTGLAAVAELHYAKGLNDPDLLLDSQSVLIIGEDKVDVLNVVTGLQANVGRTTSLRFGVVLPLLDGFDRAFDAELNGSLIKRF